MYVLVTAAKCRVCVFVRAGNVVQPHQSEKKRSNDEFQYQIMYGCIYIHSYTVEKHT